MEWYKAFNTYINIINQFQVLFLKKVIFLSAWTAHLRKKVTYHTITFELCSQKLWKLLGLKEKPTPLVVWKFQIKKIKTPFVMSCPKFLCCQKMQLGPLGVKKHLNFFSFFWIINKEVALFLSKLSKYYNKYIIYYFNNYKQNKFVVLGGIWHAENATIEVMKNETLEEATSFLPIRYVHGHC